VSRLAQDMLGGGHFQSAKKRQLRILPSLFSELRVGAYWRHVCPELTDAKPATLIYICPNEVNRVQGETRDRWLVLCEQAATEQDPHTLMELIREINCLLEEKEQRLREQRAGKTTAA